MLLKGIEGVGGCSVRKIGDGTDYGKGNAVHSRDLRDRAALHFGGHRAELAVERGFVLRTGDELVAGGDQAAMDVPFAENGLRGCGKQPESASSAGKTVAAVSSPPVQR